MMFYRVRDWSAFEVNRTREMKVMQWIAMPIKLDGNGYSAIMDLDDGGMIFGFWNAILQVAGRCEERGVLKSSSGKALDYKSLARMTRFKKDDVKRALDVLSGAVEDDIDWLEIVLEEGEGAEIPHEGAGRVRYKTRQDKTRQDKEGVEELRVVAREKKDASPFLDNQVKEIFDSAFGRISAHEKSYA